VKAALEASQPIVIVAIGSSSTQSWMSSDRGHSYPAVLQEALTRLLPQAHVSVINRGINGQDAPEEVSRLDSDAIAVKPQLVIWQVGANGALQSENTEVFKKLVTAGIARIKAAGADVILMDNQRSPRILQAPNHDAMDAALAQTAAETGSDLFRRGHLMDMWRDAGSPYAEFVSSDSLHLNDRGYHCIAEALAAAIVAGLGSGI